MKTPSFSVRVAVLAWIMLPFVSSQAATLVNYTFTNATGAGTPSNVDSSVSASNISLGYSSSGMVGYSSSANNYFERLRTPTGSSTSWFMPTSLAAATTAGTYVEFTLTPQTGQTIDLSSLSVDLSAQNTSGSSTYTDYTFFTNVQVTINGVTTDLGTVSYFASGSVADPADLATYSYPAENHTFDLSVLGDLTSAATFRLTVYLDPGTTANYYETIRLDNISVSAVPEPRMAALLAGAVALLTLRVRRSHPAAI